MAGFINHFQSNHVRGHRGETCPLLAVDGTQCSVKIESKYKICYFGHVLSHLENQCVIESYEESQLSIHFEEILKNLQHTGCRNFYLDWAGKPELCLPIDPYLEEISQCVFSKLLLSGCHHACEDLMHAGFDFKDKALLEGGIKYSDDLLVKAMDQNNEEAVVLLVLHGVSVEKESRIMSACERNKWTFEKIKQIFCRHSFMGVIDSRAVESAG